MKISREEAIGIANKEANRLGYNAAKMKIEIDEENTWWNSYIASSPSFWEQHPHIQEKLHNRDYWAVFYGSQDRTRLGGDLWVFVDRASGEIIMAIKGK